MYARFMSPEEQKRLLLFEAANYQYVKMYNVHNITCNPYVCYPYRGHGLETFHRETPNTLWI